MSGGTVWLLPDGVVLIVGCLQDLRLIWPGKSVRVTGLSFFSLSLSLYMT
jgi:hypothetical protein